MKKRILALALIVAMFLSLFPGQVFATETPSEHTENSFVEVHETESSAELVTEALTEALTEAPTEAMAETEPETHTECVCHDTDALGEEKGNLRAVTHSGHSNYTVKLTQDNLTDYLVAKDDIYYFKSTSYCLTEDITYNHHIGIDANVIICLNGHKLTITNDRHFDIQEPGKLTLYNCKADGYCRTYRAGSAIYVRKNATLVVNGAYIYNKYNEDSSTGILAEGTVDFKDGKIASSKTTISAASGSNVTITAGTFVSDTSHGFIVSSGGKLTMNGGSVTGENCGISNSGTVTVNGGTVKGSSSHGISNSGTLRIEGGTVQGSDRGISNTGNATIVNGKITGSAQGIYSTKSLTVGTDNTNDITVKATEGDGTGIYINGGTASVKRTTVSVPVTSDASSKGIVVRNSSELKMWSGTSVSGVTGVYVYEGCTFTMNNGNIDGVQYGINSGGTTTVNGGTITSNIGIHVSEASTLTVNSGTVQGATSGIRNKGTINVNGGTITGTSAYAIEVSSAATATNMGGSPSLTGGMAAIYLANNKVINMTDTVPAEKSYMVKTQQTISEPGEKIRIATSWSTANRDTGLFTNTENYVSKVIDNVLYFTIPTVTVIPSIGGTVTASPAGGKPGTTITLTPTADAGYYLGTISYSYEDGSGTVTQTVIPANGVYSFEMPAADVTVRSEFEFTIEDIDLSLYLWKDHEAMVTEAALLEILRSIDPNAEVLEANCNYDHLFIPDEQTGFTMDTITTADGTNGIVFRANESGLLQGKLEMCYVRKGTDVPLVVDVWLNVKSYEVKDSVFILDYDMDVMLVENLFAQDILPGIFGGSMDTELSPYGFTTAEPDYKVDYTNLTQSLEVENAQQDVEGTYGDFRLGELVYAPKAFINGPDSVYLAFRAVKYGENPSEDGAIDIFKEAAMYKKVTILPANAVYYEDGFAALNWNPDETDETDGIKIEILTADSTGDGYQDGDNSSPYGNDSDYQYAPEGEYYGSGGHSKKITVTKTGPVLTFTFKGTGFDLIGSTTANSGQFMYKIFPGEKAEGSSIKSGALDTSYGAQDSASSTGDAAIHEVPLLHVQDLTHGTYTVLIQAVANYDWYAPQDQWVNNLPPVIPIYLYFDGVRIYHPLPMGSPDRDSYIPGEDTATFVQLRNMILEGQAAAAKFEYGMFSFGSGLVSYVETAKNGLTYEGNKVTSLNDYLLAGPNNEVYFNEETQTLVLYVKETGAQDVTPMLQIGVRNLNPEAFDNAEGDSNNAPEFVLLGAGGTVVQTLVSAEKAISYTEQYYTVQYKNCVVETINGINYYRVVIMAGNSSAFSLTNLKVSGMEFYTIPASAATYKYDKDGNLMESSNPNATEMPNLQELAWQLQAANGMLPEDELPGVSAELKFSSVSLSLQSSIGMNFYVAKETLEQYTDPSIVVTMEDKTLGENGEGLVIDFYELMTIGEKEYYVFSFNEITAKEMTNKVTATLKAKGDNGTEVTGESREYSVITYAMNMLKKEAVPGDLKTLLVDMVNYGAAAQNYFGYKTDRLANAGFSGYQELASEAVADFVSCSYSDSGAPDMVSSIERVSISLNDKVELNFYVTLPYDGDFTDTKLVVAYFDVTGSTVVKEIPYSTETFTFDENNSWYKVVFDGLNATDMRTPVTAWLADKDGMRISNSKTYSIESYCASMMAGTSEAHLKVQPLLIAMMKYGDAAEAYFGKTAESAQ